MTEVVASERLIAEIRAFSKLQDALRAYEELGFDAIDVERATRRMLAVPVGSLTRYDQLRSMRYSEYLRTPEWATHRDRARRRAGGRCQGCGDIRHLETHHVTYENLGWEEPEDLTVLCAACHTAVHLVADGRRNKVRSESRRPSR